jgi:hypothetical protein
MRLKRMIAGGFLAVLTAAIATVAWAQSGGGYDASYNATTAGGTTMSGGGYVLQTGAGQAVIGQVASGGAYTLDIGVLAGGEGASAAPSPSASPSASASASPSPSGTPLPNKRYSINVAKDGID